MTQNIYDDETFFAGYSRLRRSVEGLDGAPEWPALRALLPPRTGARVLDLGCGFGWFARWARQEGAAHVLAVDVSEKMLARARALTADAAISYVRADLEHLAVAPQSFELAYSALVFHYVADLDALLSTIERALVPGGRLVFSVEHPIYTAPRDARWSTDGAGRKTWRVDAYLEEGPRVTDWLAPGVVKHHRTVGSYLNALLRAQLTVSHVEEWGPTDAQIAERPELADERQRPAFLLVAAERAAR
jgi:SAM-dependent methyltransferase